MTASAEFNRAKTFAFAWFCIWPSFPSWWDVKLGIFNIPLHCLRAINLIYTTLYSGSLGTGVDEERS